MKTTQNKKLGKRRPRGNYMAMQNIDRTIENWFCPECHTLNNGYRKKCRECGEKKPKGDLLEQFKTQRE